MQAINLSSYYDKISTIRAKILTKHSEPPTHTPHQYPKTNPPTANLQVYQSKAVENTQGRAPLELKSFNEQKGFNEQNVSDRLKELDSVNQKIKRILGDKRQPSSNATKNSTTLQNNEHNTKRITSLFQNQQNIVESKVGLLGNWTTSKEKPYGEKPYPASSFKYTAQSRIMTNERSQNYKREEKTITPNPATSNSGTSNPVALNSGTVTSGMTRAFNPTTNKLQLLREQKQRSNLKDYSLKDYNLISDSYRLDNFKKASDLSFGDKQNQPVEAQNDYPYIIQQTSPTNPDTLSYGRPRYQTQKLVQSLSDQASLDIKLRQSREEFHHLQSETKWAHLTQELASYSLHIDRGELERWVTISPEELNPFTEKVSSAHFSFGEMAARFAQSWSHWNNKLKDAVSISKLEEQAFKIQEIDVEGKTYISIQDLVCFLNLNSESSLRNRDLVGMFKRWNSWTCGGKVQSRVSYQTFLNFVTR